MNSGASFEGFTSNPSAYGNQNEAGATFEPPVQATSVEKIEPANTENAAETMMAESAEKVEFAPSTGTAETMEKTAIEGVPEPAIVPGEGIKSESEDLAVSEEISAVPVAETVQNEAYDEPAVEAPVAPVSFEEQFAKIVSGSVGNKAFATTEEIKADVDMPKEAERSVSESGDEGISNQEEEKEKGINAEQIKMSLEVIKSELENIRAAINDNNGEISESQKFGGDIAA